MSFWLSWIPFSQNSNLKLHKKAKLKGLCRMCKCTLRQFLFNNSLRLIFYYSHAIWVWQFRFAMQFLNIKFPTSNHQRFEEIEILQLKAHLPDPNRLCKWTLKSCRKKQVCIEPLKLNIFPARPGHKTIKLFASKLQFIVKCLRLTNVFIRVWHWLVKAGLVYTTANIALS
jgi:hypothetical protein